MEQTLQTARKTAFIRRKDSQTLRGMAILMMIFHHCFCIPDRLGSGYIPLLRSYPLEMKIAWLCKLCVAFFVFITGYGLARASRKAPAADSRSRLRFSMRQSLRHAAMLYCVFWLVFAIFVPLGMLFFGLRPTAREMVKAFFFGMALNGEWWYILQYLCILVAYPLLDLLACHIEKKNPLAVAALLLFTAQFWVLRPLYQRKIFVGFSEYMLLFIAAYAIGRFRLYEQLVQRVKLPRAACVLGILACLALRWFFVKDPTQSACDILLMPPLMFFTVPLTRLPFFESRIAPFFRFWGKYSTFIWLSHTYWLYYYFQSVVLLPRYSLLVFLWGALLSLLTGIALDWLYRHTIGKGAQKIAARLTA